MDQEPSGPVAPTQEEKTHAMLSWILVILGCLGWVGPLVFLMQDKAKPFAYRHAARAFTTSITFIVALIVLYVLFFALAMALGPLALIGLPVELLLGVGVLVCIIMGAVKASSGEEFEPPVVSAICKALFKV